MRNIAGWYMYLSVVFMCASFIVEDKGIDRFSEQGVKTALLIMLPTAMLAPIYPIVAISKWMGEQHGS